MKRSILIVLLFGLAMTSVFAYGFIGSGTEIDPYQIENIDDLIELSGDDTLRNKHFIQTADIDASSTIVLNDGDGFIPIGGTWGLPFTGSYDGQCYKISGLYINRPDTDYVGLFGITSEANISNVGLVDNEISGQNRVGSLVGFSELSTFSNCYATGSVSGTNIYIGGLVGRISYSFISNSYATCSVNGSLLVGGLVGFCTASSDISNCYATGSVSGGYDIGGLVGQLGVSSINNCYATGVVSGDENVGGLVGHGSGSVLHSFWDIQTSGVTNSAVGEGKTTLQMKDIYTYLDAGWDFEVETENGTADIWIMNDTGNNGYPYLVWTDELDETLPVTLSLFKVIETSNNMAQITWVTASENDLLGYNLYRSESADQEEALRVTATMIEAINSATESHYSFVDTEVEYEVTYNYWLQTTDFKGLIEMVGPVTVKISQNDNYTENTPLVAQLLGNYPNPFNPETTISFDLNKDLNVKLEIFNLKGQKIKILCNGNLEAGSYKYTWNGTDNNNRPVASGVYFSKITSEVLNKMRKMILIK